MMPDQTYNHQELYNDRVGQMTFGFVGHGHAISPVGIVSMGFLWGCADIWSLGYNAPTTAWASASSSLATSWSSASASLTTNWSGTGTAIPWAEC